MGEQVSGSGERQRALWALAEPGAWGYERAQLNQGVARWRRCHVGNEVGYLE